MSWWGIETEEQCDEALGELMCLHARVHGSLADGDARRTKEYIKALKSKLREYYPVKTEGRAPSDVEKNYLYPAVQEACAFAPKLNSPRTWNDGIYRIGSALEERKGRLVNKICGVADRTYGC